jgi:hypothetical protein
MKNDQSLIESNKILAWNPINTPRKSRQSDSNEERKKMRGR